MFEVSAEFLPTRLTAVEWRVFGIAVGNGGQGAGRVFLHTLLSRNKRVWRRAGPQPRDLDLRFKAIKATTKPAGLVPPDEALFCFRSEKSPKDPAPISPATIVATCIPQSFPGRSHALRLTSRQSSENDCSTPVETKGGWKSEAKTRRHFGSLEKIGPNLINPSALPIPQPLTPPV